MASTTAPAQLKLPDYSHDDLKRMAVLNNVPVDEVARMTAHSLAERLTSLGVFEREKQRLLSSAAATSSKQPPRPATATAPATTKATPTTPPINLNRPLQHSDLGLPVSSTKNVNPRAEKQRADQAAGRPTHNLFYPDDDIAIAAGGPSRPSSNKATDLNDTYEDELRRQLLGGQNASTEEVIHQIILAQNNQNQNQNQSRSSSSSGGSSSTPSSFFGNGGTAGIDFPSEVSQMEHLCTSAEGRKQLRNGLKIIFQQCNMISKKIKKQQSWLQSEAAQMLDDEDRDVFFASDIEPLHRQRAETIAVAREVGRVLTSKVNQQQQVHSSITSSTSGGGFVEHWKRKCAEMQAMRNTVSKFLADYQ